MKKQTNKRFLSSEELLILALYHASEKVDFNIFQRTDDGAKRFASILNQPTYKEANDIKWYESAKEINGINIHAAGFLELGDTE